MTRIVSDEEVSAILGPDGTAAAEAAIVPYDFRRPERVTGPQLRAVRLLHETFAADAGTWLAAMLRTTTELQLLDVDQLTYGDFISMLPEFTVAYVLGMVPTDAALMLSLTPDVTFTMVDRILGGTGASVAPDRPLTEIEQNVIDSAMKLLVDQLTAAWRSLGAQFTIQTRHSRLATLPVTRSSDPLVVLTFTLRVSETTGSLRLSIPAAVFDALGDAFARTTPDSPRQRTGEQSAWLQANLDRVPLAITAELSTMLAARELIDLAPGVVISLGHQSDQPLTIRVGDVPAFVGHLVVHNSSLAVRVDAAHQDESDLEESR